eukprot:1808858-Amphidinium_carterae.1
MVVLEVQVQEVIKHVPKIQVQEACLQKSFSRSPLHIPARFSRGRGALGGTAFAPPSDPQHLICHSLKLLREKSRRSHREGH